MKKILFKLILALQRRNWSNGKRLNILIQINEYFTPDKWKKKLSKYFKAYKQSEIIYSHNKFLIAKLIKSADYAFLLGLSHFISLSASRVRFIYFGTVGLEFLEEIAIPNHIKFSNSKKISSEAIAEYVLASALLIHRRIYTALRNQVLRKWDQKALIWNNYAPLRKKVVGIMGVGNNGKMIAKYFKNIGCTVLGYDVFKSLDNHIDIWYGEGKIQEFLRNIDILVLSLPLTKDTKYIINRNTLSCLRHGAIIINIARGDIINEKDLLLALKEKKIFCAMLDVFPKEPLKFYDRKWKHPNIIITPHISGNINLFVDKIQTDFIMQLNNMV